MEPRNHEASHPEGKDQSDDHENDSLIHGSLISLCHHPTGLVRFDSPPLLVTRADESNRDCERFRWERDAERSLTPETARVSAVE